MERQPTELEKLYDKAENYAKTTVELTKLTVIDKSADVLSSVTVLIAIGIVFALFTLFLNLALGLYLGKLFGDYYLGFLIVSAFYLILCLFIYLIKEKYIKATIANLVITKLLKEKI